MRARRKVEVFSLSFLDCICCGFGAVVLFYAISAGQAGVKRIEKTDQLAAEVNRLEEEVLEGTRHLVVLRNTLEKTQDQTAAAAARTRTLLDEVASTREEALRAGATSMAQREHINRLKADVAALEQGANRLRGGAVDAAPPGQQTRAFRGTGNRRYITGIQLKGQRILVLFDRSASMLDDDVVNVIRLRNQPQATQRAAWKWRQALDIADWLSTQFPPGSQFQLYGFNTQAATLVDGSEGAWRDSSDPRVVEAAVQKLRGLAPEGGTSLLNAFKVVQAMNPKPDQVVLVTDGLPTQGERAPLRRLIGADARARLFDEAARSLPQGVPVDVILLPMQGDIPAPHRFWTLARASGGSFLMPSRDWP